MDSPRVDQIWDKVWTVKRIKFLKKNEKKKNLQQINWENKAMDLETSIRLPVISFPSHLVNRLFNCKSYVNE